MGKNERKWIRPLAAFVDEVNANVVHLGFEVSKPIEIGFVLTPVIGIEPVGNQFLQVAEIGTGVPTAVLYLIGPAGVFQSLPQVSQQLWRNVDSEWTDYFVFHRFFGTWWGIPKVGKPSRFTRSGKGKAGRITYIFSLSEVDQTFPFSRI